MLKFFRKIRQKLLEENKIGNYLKYAIGEILLVVIGILIALQINNWNENNKSHATEIKILKELKLALQQDLFNINVNIRSYKDVNRSLEIIKEQLQLDEITNDSLGYAFSKSLFNNSVAPTIGPYETLKSKGLDLISNDTLRQDIILVYEMAYKYYQDKAKDRFLPEAYIQEYCAGLFKGMSIYDDDPEAMVPNDLALIKTDQIYHTIINTRIAQVRQSKSELELNQILVSKLIESIDKELNK